LKIYPTAEIADRTIGHIDAHENTFIGSQTFIACAYLKMEEGAHINAGAKLQGRGRIFMGKYSVIGYDALLMTSTDTPAGRMSDFAPESERRIKTGDIVLEEESFVGSKAIIMPGVTIGKRSVIGAGAFISRNIPPDTIVQPKIIWTDMKRKVAVSALKGEAKKSRKVNDSEEET
jgi:acetyltransferase-like isoleucine patch superfamily enzyme